MGFRKAVAEQAALKIALYGGPGRGKTLTALIMAEGLAAAAGKRVAFIDTERGTDFYTKAVPERRCHPEAFDFDALYTRSITEVLKEVRALRPADYGVVVIDSITHLWEAARAAYNGKTNSNGALPLYAWGQIKKPYKELMSVLLTSPMHVIICGREGTEFAEDDTGEMKAVGKKMKAEGETPYEPHILIRMMDPPDGKYEDQTWCFVEKDRSAVLKGQWVQLWPNRAGNAYELLAGRWLPLLNGQTQAHIQGEAEHATADAEALAAEEAARVRQSERLLTEWTARIALAADAAALKELGKSITPDLKRQMVNADVAALREAYQKREQTIGGVK